MSPEIKWLVYSYHKFDLMAYLAYLHKYGTALAVLVQPVFHAVVCHAEGGLMGGALVTVIAVVIKSWMGDVSLILVWKAGVIQSVVNLQRCVLVLAVDVGIVCAELGGHMTPSPQCQSHAAGEQKEVEMWPIKPWSLEIN